MTEEWIKQQPVYLLHCYLNICYEISNGLVLGSFTLTAYKSNWFLFLAFSTNEAQVEITGEKQMSRNSFVI